MYSSNRSCIYDKRFLLKWGLSSANSHATLVVMITQTLWQVEGEARSSFNVAKFIAEAHFCHPEMAIILLGWIIGSLNPKNVRDPLRNNNGNTTTFRRTIYPLLLFFLINLQPKKTYSTKLSITCIPKKFWIILQQISNRKKKRRKIDLVEKQGNRNILAKQESHRFLRSPPSNKRPLHPCVSFAIRSHATRIDE